jgi:hypothetical protein
MNAIIHLLLTVIIFYFTYAYVSQGYALFIHPNRDKESGLIFRLVIWVLSPYLVFFAFKDYFSEKGE